MRTRVFLAALVPGVLLAAGCGKHHADASAYPTTTFTVGASKGDICYREGRPVAVFWVDDYGDGTVSGGAGGFRGEIKTRGLRAVDWTYTFATQKITVRGDGEPLVFDIRKGGLFLIAAHQGPITVEQREIDLSALPPASDPGGAAAAGEKLSALAAADEVIAAFLRNAGGAK
jgi:hypothetical protein